jgi:hypothetical protein
MDLLSLLTGSENLYKYLMIGGIGMLVLGLLYPLNKKYELICQKDSYAKEINVLNYKIDNLYDSVQNFQIRTKQIEKSLDTIKDKTIIQSLKDEFANTDNRYQKDLIQSHLNSFNAEYDKNRIKTLETHIGEFQVYEKIFFWGGIACSIIGIIGWFLLMRKAP